MHLVSMDYSPLCCPADFTGLQWWQGFKIFPLASLMRLLKRVAKASDKLLDFYFPGLMWIRLLNSATSTWKQATNTWGLTTLLMQVIICENKLLAYMKHVDSYCLKGGRNTCCMQITCPPPPFPNQQCPHLNPGLLQQPSWWAMSIFSRAPL